MATAVDVLSRWVDVEHLRLGGGTVLEARWHHRSSTDLDFFTLADHADIVFYERLDEITEDLIELVSAGTVDNKDLRVTQRKILHFSIGDTPVSWGSTALFHDDPRQDVERDTGVILSGNKDILAKKLDGRLVGNQLVTARDAYDFAVARTIAPDDLSYAWGILTPHNKGIAVGLYKTLAANAPGQEPPHMDIGRPLLAPHHGKLAANLWNEVLKMFESDLEHIPPLTVSDADSVGEGRHGGRTH